MDEKEKMINKVTESAMKKAQKQKLNEEQTKILVNEEVKKALEEFNAQVEKTTQKSTQENAQPKVEKQETKKYIVYTPVKNYNGEVAGVQFAYGKAEVKAGWILNWFKEHNYKVEEVSE